MTVAWLVKHLETKTGLPNGTRAAWAHRCRSCREIVITGLNDDWCAFTRTVDPTPLGTLGEALAHLAGRKTYSLHREGPKRFRIARRTRRQIPGRPAGTETIARYDVVTDHVCGQSLSSIPSRFAHAQAVTTFDDQPPF